MTQASEYLFAKAGSIVSAYTRYPEAQAAMVTGSVAEGISDFYSDVDITVYYLDAFPTEDELTFARKTNKGSERLWLLGDRQGGSFAEAYKVDGIEFQIGHTLVSTWERDIKIVQMGEDVTTPLHKAMSGTLDCISLYGEDRIAAWKAQIADFPVSLSRQMVERYLRFFPIWGIEERLSVRDTTLWRQQVLLETAQNSLGIMAGLNHLYYSGFQFKRMRAFIEKMKIAPSQFADRLEILVTAEPSLAISTAESLVLEICDLVETHLPEVETSGVRKRLGWRQSPWSMLPS